MIRFRDRSRLGSAIGRIPNLASRLCTEAKAGQVLVSEPVFLSVEAKVEAAHLGHLVLKGFQDPVPAYAVTRWREGDAAAA